jgi:hypothetical protein
LREDDVVHGPVPFGAAWGADAGEAEFEDHCCGCGGRRGIGMVVGGADGNGEGEFDAKEEVEVGRKV